MEVGDVLPLELCGGEAAGVEGQPRVPPQPAGQPGQVAVTDEIVVGHPQGAQTEQLVKQILRQRRQVVVIQRPVTMLYITTLYNREIKTGMY